MMCSGAFHASAGAPCRVAKQCTFIAIFGYLGIGAILDYCAEADMDHGQGGASDDLDHPALPAMPELDTFPASQIQQYTVNPNMMDRRQVQ